MLSQSTAANVESSRKSVPRKFSWKEYAILVFAGMIGVLGGLPAAWSVLEKKATLSKVPVQLLATGQLVQSTFWMFLIVGIGLLLATKTGLGAPILRSYLAGEQVGAKFRSHILPSVLLALFATMIVIALDRLFFLPRMPGFSSAISQISGWKGIPASLYGGRTEEILIRLFFLTLLAWIWSRFSHTDEGKPSSIVMWIAIVTSAVIFGLGHLSATLASTPFSVTVLVRALLLNGIYGLIFGYLYRTKSQKMKTIYQNILKSLLVGMVYALALIIGGFVVSALGLRLPQAKDVMSKMLWSFAGGAIAGLCLGPIAASIPTTRTRHLIVWGSLIFLNLASVAIEGFLFVPEVVGNTLPALLVQLFLVSLATGWMITVLFAPAESAVSVQAAYRPVFSWMWRFPASALTYVFFYFVFGAANYILVTKPYYQSHAGGLAVPATAVTLTAEIIRGVLITLSILPFVLTMCVNKTRLAVQSGFILFAIGGLVPLTLQVGVLPLFLLAASAVEIFFQNFSTGFVVARLMSSGSTTGATK